MTTEAPDITPVDMTLFMDDITAGQADEAVNLGHHAGDCLRACIATITKAPLGAVPHFVQYIEHPEGTDPLLWWYALVGWCHQHGWEARWIPANEADPPTGLALGHGPSVRGHEHAVVMHDGQLLHDPHPSRDGITAVRGWITMRRA